MVENYTMCTKCSNIPFFAHTDYVFTTMQVAMADLAGRLHIDIRFDQIVGGVESKLSSFICSNCVNIDMFHLGSLSLGWRFPLGS